MSCECELFEIFLTKLLPIVLLTIALTGCQNKPEPAASKPSDAVTRYYAAVNAHDTGAYMKSISASRAESMRKNPVMMRKVMDHWKDRHADVQIITQSEEGTVGLVEYHVKITGADPMDTTLKLQVYKEDDGWKFGYF